MAADYTITDELLGKMSEPKARIRVKGKFYVVAADPNVVDGDCVLDRQDGAYGFIDGIEAGHAGVRDGGIVELGVPLGRLVRLQLAENQEEAS